MRRYWIPNITHAATAVPLHGDYFHHICEVCRQGLGAKFEVISEDGWALLVEIDHVGKRDAIAKVLEKRQLPPLPEPRLNLAVSIPKIPTLEGVLEKSVELGVAKVWPFFSDYSFVKTKKSLVQDKMPRFRKIVQSATQQTGRGDLMDIAEAQNLDALLKIFSMQHPSHGVFAYEGEGGRSLKHALSGRPEGLKDLWIFVGSEGGFSHQEVEIFKKINLFPVSLGQQVLRVETACVTLLSIIKYEIGLF